MRLMQSRLGGLATAPAPETLCDYDRIPARRGSQPARCELHGVNIVDGFPAHCPFATPNPLETIGQLQDVAWRELGRGDPGRDSDGALALLDRIDVCERCISRLAVRPTVRRLRRDWRVPR